MYLDKVKSNPMYATYTRQKKYRGFKDNSTVKLGERVRKEDIMVSNLFRSEKDLEKWNPQIYLM